MLILTGGEPLVRGDLYEIIKHASSIGLSVVVGTNGTLLDENTVERLRACGLKGVGISVDSVNPASHDSFRGMPGAWEKTLNSADLLKSQGLEFQMQFTVTKSNFDEIPALIELAWKKGAKAANVFFLVCTGRGQEMTDISPAQYESMLKYLAEAENEYAGRIMVRARCAPHFLRLVQQMHPDSPVMKGATSGCIAGTGYFRITPEGDVTPCPYMPTSAGNIKKRPLSDIWSNTDIFGPLRNRRYSGKCGDCKYNEACGGCLARALATSGDVMGEDPWCGYEPEKGEKTQSVSGEPLWDEAALVRLERVPSFLRKIVKGGMERYAKTKGVRLITPELMAEVRSRTGGKGRP